MNKKFKLVICEYAVFVLYIFCYFNIHTHIYFVYVTLFRCLCAPKIAIVCVLRRSCMNGSRGLLCFIEHISLVVLVVTYSVRRTSMIWSRSDVTRWMKCCLKQFLMKRRWEVGLRCCNCWCRGSNGPDKGKNRW